MHIRDIRRWTHINPIYQARISKVYRNAGKKHWDEYWEIYMEIKYLFTSPSLTAPFYVCTLQESAPSRPTEIPSLTPEILKRWANATVIKHLGLLP